MDNFFAFKFVEMKHAYLSSYKSLFSLWVDCNYWVPNLVEIIQQRTSLKFLCMIVCRYFGMIKMLNIKQKRILVRTTNIDYLTTISSVYFKAIFYFFFDARCNCNRQCVTRDAVLYYATSNTKNWSRSGCLFIQFQGGPAFSCNAFSGNPLDSKFTNTRY